MNRLEVHLHDQLVGHLERAEHGRLRFGYEEGGASSATPLSLSLPARAEPFDDEECRGFFSGLLPEGGFLRAVARAFGVSASNPFSVLEAIGGECAGAVSLAPPGAGPPSPSAPRWLDEGQLHTLLADSPDRILLSGLGGEGLRLSLAGAQEKLPVMFGGGRVAVTGGEPPSTHILKLRIDGFVDTVASESYCLTLARASGLDAVEAEARSATSEASFADRADGALPYLLVTRYDRSEGPQVRRIHQEDFCQALGFSPEVKYEADGGPGIARCAELISRHSAIPARDRLALADALVFNLVIGNHDAHSKNYSLMLEGADAPRMAPLYDLLSTSIYPGLTRKLAMGIGGEHRPDYIRARHLDRAATDLGMRPNALRRRAKALCLRIEDALPVADHRAGPAFTDPAIHQQIQKQVKQGLSHLRQLLAET